MCDAGTLAADDLARENERVRQQQRAVGDVLRAVARSEGLQPVLDEIVDAAKRLCQGEHAQLYLLGDGVFRIASESGGLRAGCEYAEEHPHAPDRTTLVGRVALTGEPVQIPDV